MASSGEITLFPDFPTLLWTLVNLFVLAGLVALFVLVVMYIVRLNRRVRRLEERLNLKDDK